MKKVSATSAFLLFLAIIGSSNGVNVLDHGARGDGITVDNEAFVKAWTETCNNPKSSPLIIPENKAFLLQPIEFSGPCKSLVNIVLSGEIVAIDNSKQWKLIDEDKWIVFKNINGLIIDGKGKGKINGRGKAWWPFSCNIEKPLAGCNKRAPTALNIIGCSNVAISHINSLDSPQVHMSIYKSNLVDIGFVNIRAPATSPNTDGIHIQNAQDVKVHNSDIGSGDDCVSIGDQTTNINITDSRCGPGHGVSVGSLGKDGETVKVSHILVDNINFVGTTNGARIKTWQIGQGRAEHIQFSKLNFNQVKNPIIIDQHYCDTKTSGSCNGKGKTGVQIDDVMFAHAQGTSVTEEAINLNCSEVFPCKNIVLDSITLKSGIQGKQVKTICKHAQGRIKNPVIPDASACLAPSILQSVGAEDSIQDSEL